MRKCFTSLFLFSAVFICSLLGFVSVNAQTPMYFKGTGTGTNTIPMNTAGSHTQQIYLPADFNTLPISGLITKVWFRNSTAASTGTYTNFTVSFLQNTLAAFPDNTFLTGFTTALSAASITINGSPTVGGWYEIPLTTPFTYDNSKTLICEIKYTARTGGSSGYTTTAVGNKRLSIITAPGPATGNLSTIWGDFGIDVIPGGPCVEPPVPGTITASNNPVCLGVPFTLTATGGTNGTGQTVQWQSSPDGTTWTNIAGATNTSYSGTQTVSTFYRLNVTCGATTVSSAPIQILTPAGVSGTYTINSALPTGGTNFQSFNSAYDFIKCGIVGPVTFNVAPASGPYNEQLIMTEVPGASATNTVTFNGAGRTIQNTSTVTGQRAVIKLDGADHIKFDNLVINANGTTTTEYGFGVHFINNADSNSITNSVININTSSTSTNYAGIVMSSSHTSATTTGAASCDANTISGNIITGGYYGITCVGSTTESNANNLFSNNTIQDFYFYGIYIVGNFNTIIDSNIVTRPLRTTVSTFNGIYLNSLNINVRVSRNTITNPFGGALTSTSLFNGIFVSASDALSGVDNKLINNKIFNITGAGEANGINNTGSDNLLVQHNTILMDGAGGSLITRGFYQTTLAGGVTFDNNIVAITRAGTGAKYAIYYGTITSDIASNRNDFYLNSPTGNEFVGYYTTPQATLANWQTASGDDANSVISNPFFANAAGGDLHPTNAGIDNLGAPLGVLIDITGAARSTTTPDIGAYEFTPGNCSAPPVAGIAEVNPSVVCANTLVQFSLSGNSTGLGQLYQWQFSTTIGGPYTNIGTAAANSGFSTTATTTLYYRAAVTCSGNTAFSTPVLLTVNPALPAGTYTINSTQPTGGTNYTSFAAAGQALSCGIAGPVVFNVAAGTGPYNEQFILGAVNGTSAVNTITFNGNGNTIAFSSNDNLDRAVIKLRDADHIIFDSLVINATGAGTYGFGVHLINNADSNTFNRCTVITSTTSTSTNFAGMVISSSESSATTTGATSLCDGNTFSNNEVTGGYYGITVVGSTTAVINNNKVTGNKVKDFYFYGIYTAGTTNTLVEGNDISRPDRTTVSTHYGVYSTGVQQGLRISKNRIHAPFAGNTASTSIFYGIYSTGTDADPATPTVVSNNLVYDVKSSGTQYGIYNTSTSSANYYHNTITLDDASNTATSLSYGFYQTTLSDNINLKNNIFNITRAGTGNKFALYFATATSTIVSDYNDLYVTGTNAFTGYNGTNQATLLAWQANASQDANSVAFQPIFSSIATGNLSPLNPVIDNKGTPVGITTDILNAVRSTTTPDLGAYEFTIPPCTAPPAAGGAIAIPNSGICIGFPIDLSLSGYNIGAGQTFQWQYSTAVGGPWLPLGGPRIFPDTTILSSATLYYRAAVTCSGNTSFSTPVLVTLNPAFLAGTYTINSTIPSSATNFTSFATAVAALECGITGPVFFDIAPNTYNEQIRMHNVAGTSPTVRVTFRSANGNPASVILTNNAASATANYTLQLDSASYITYRSITINATNTTNGRVVELANTASADSIVNCVINAPVTTGTVNTSAGIFTDLLKGSANVFKGNTVNNGNIGINLEGTSTTNLTYDNVIDSNTVNGAYYYGMYIGNTGRTKVNKNTVNVTMPRNTTNYGMYSISSDSAYQYTANKILISGMTATTTYGMYFSGCDGRENNLGRIAGNTITAVTGNTGTLYGLYQTASTNNNTVNNVISTATTGATSYASYYTGGGGVRFQNNSIVNASASTGTTNAAAYFAQTSATNPAVNIQNNIFSHTGGGNAVYITNLNFIYSDYNTYYTASAPLFRTTAALTYATLPVWVNFSYWDVNSISYEPKFVDNISLRPDLANPDVWAIHGRGTQLPGNDYDFDNNPRPTTFTTGVPDMGAYEFLPTSLPTLLTATPPTPAPGTTQTFMYGTDTVARITYDATAPVPASINLRRYSGVLPTGLATGQQSMYFYTDIDVPAQGAYKYKVQQYYIDPWRGFIPTEAQVQLGKTNAANAWVVQPNATTDVFMNIMADTGQVYIDRFTGLTGTPPNTQTTYTTVIDSSNRGTRFWVPYGHHYSFSTNGQDMLLYLSAQDSANVTVRINGTNWVRTYAIPANTVRVSDIIPKYGLIDARIDNEGLYEHGISIVSDIPIVAYAHIYDGATSGASLLLPVGVYGYDYQSLNSAQYYPTGGAGSYSWMNVMTDRDSALVEITPAVTTRGGRPAGVPFTVTLMRGQVYSIMGTINGAQGTDLSGTKIRSIANSSGNCYPIAVFSGSSRTSICNTTNGDNLIQQVFPSQAWGRKYLTFSTANSTSNTLYNSNIFRVMVKDPTTVVMKNGVALNPATLVVPGNYYEFNTTQGTGTNGAIYVEADKPVMMAQYMVSTGANSCPGVTATGNGDPEMIYISPIEQGIKQATFYNTTESAITSNYVNIVIPTTGLASLRVDGTVSTFTEVFAHPFLTGYSCVRHNLPAAAGQHRVTSDSAFTAITYGLGSVESYGYNAGTLVKNLNAVAAIANTLGSGATSDYTCVGAPFRFSVLISAKPTQLTWKFSAVPQLNPNVDSIQVNPRPVDSTLINNRWYYRYVVQANFTFSAVGTYNIPIIITDPLTIEGCNNSVEITLPVRVIPAPTIDFAAAAVCLGNQTVFTGTGTTANSVPISSYSWTFGDNTSGTGQNTTHTYATAGTFNVNFSLVSSDGCFAAVTKPVVVNPIPSVAVAVDSLVVCGASPATFTVQNPVTGVTYRWYNVPTGGTALATGTSYTIPSVVGTTVLYVEPTSAAGCVGARVRVVATLLPDLIAPVVTVDSIGVDRIRFRWTAVPGAISYEVSTNAGSTWSTPSSGAAGLTHTITGLQPLSDVTLRVRAIGSAPCQQSVSVDVPGKTLPDAIFIPNAFSPNGDGINDILFVYGYTIQSLRFAVFNQWGEKIFESSNQSTGWDGRYKGKLQPSGVYMYVCQLTLRDGSTQVKKGSINLVQ